MVASVVESWGSFLCGVRHFICVVDVWGGSVIVRT